MNAVETCPDCQRPLYQDIVHMCRAAPKGGRAVDGLTIQAPTLSETEVSASRLPSAMYAGSYLPWQLLRPR